LTLVRQVGKIITLEEHAVQGGFGSAVLELLHAHNLLVPVRCLGLPDKFIEQGPQSLLRHKYRLDAEGVEDVICYMLQNKGGA